MLILYIFVHCVRLRYCYYCCLILGFPPVCFVGLPCPAASSFSFLSSLFLLSRSLVTAIILCSSALSLLSFCFFPPRVFFFGSSTGVGSLGVGGLFLLLYCSMVIGLGPICFSDSASKFLKTLLNSLSVLIWSAWLSVTVAM